MHLSAEKDRPEEGDLGIIFYIYMNSSFYR